MNISQQTRDEVVQLYSQHLPVREIMSRFGVSRSSIYNYLKLDRKIKVSNWHFDNIGSRY